VKVYSDLSATVYDAIVREAAVHGLPVVGHVPTAVGLRHALRSGQSSIEHLSGYLTAAQAEDAPERATSDWAAVASFDETRLPDLARWTRASGVWNCVTLVAMRRFTTADEARRLLERPEVRYVAPMSREGWAPENFEGWTDEKLAPFRRARTMLLEITRALHGADARILLGTDSANPHVVPGFSIHEELELLVQAGMSPYEAIRAGTRDAAEFLGLQAEFGTVQAGRRADLILLEANPLEDVANVRRRVGVMLRGRWYPEAEIGQRLLEIAAGYGYTDVTPPGTSVTPEDAAQTQEDAPSHGVPIAILVAVPLIAAFFLFVLLPRLRGQSGRPQR
jgi:imidazolonepropionase-like amidohydrolase